MEVERLEEEGSPLSTVQNGEEAEKEHQARIPKTMPNKEEVKRLLLVG